MNAKLIFDLIADELPRLNNLSLQQFDFPATANTGDPRHLPGVDWIFIGRSMVFFMRQGRNIGRLRKVPLPIVGRR
jgi:hypothetical protein